MEIDLKRLVRLAGEHAHRVLLEEGKGLGQLMPTFYLIVPPPGRDVNVGAPWASTEEKIAALAEVKRLSHEIGAIGASFVSEVWLRSVPKPWHAARTDLTTPPSESPDRIEAVFAIATDGVRTEVGWWQIVRDRPGGRIISLVEEKEVKGEFSGRILDGLVRCAPKSE